MDLEIWSISNLGFIIYIKRGTRFCDEPEDPDILKNLDFDEEEEITIEQCLIKDSDLKIFDDSSKLFEIFSGASTFQERWNISDKVITVFYNIAEELFEQKKFIESRNIFSFLTLMNQNIAIFWLGKGAANESLENWDSALDDYWMAQSINQMDHNIYIVLIRIYGKLKNEMMLDECFKIIKKHPALEEHFFSKS